MLGNTNSGGVRLYLANRKARRSSQGVGSYGDRPRGFSMILVSISELERGLKHDTGLARRYRRWLDEHRTALNATGSRLDTDRSVFVACRGHTRALQAGSVCVDGAPRPASSGSTDLGAAPMESPRVVGSWQGFDPDELRPSGIFR